MHRVTGNARGLRKLAGTDPFATGYCDEIFNTCREHTELCYISRIMQTYRWPPGGATLNAKVFFVNNSQRDQDKNLKFSWFLGDHKGYLTLKFCFATITTSGLAGDQKFDGGKTGHQVWPFGVNHFCLNLGILLRIDPKVLNSFFF